MNRINKLLQKHTMKQDKFLPGAVIEKSGKTETHKTGGWRSFKPVWDESKCIQCMRCWQFCPDVAIPQKNGKRIETDFNLCKGCLICAEVCPVKCIKGELENK